MAGWIPYSKTLPDKPEVLHLAAATGRSRYEVVGILMAFWAWLDEHSDEGFLRLAPASADGGMAVDARVSILSGLCAPIDAQFVRAMCEVGWLVFSPEGILCPHFERWMGEGARARLQRNQRQARYRDRKGGTSGKPSIKRGKPGKPCGRSAPQRKSDASVDGRVDAPVDAPVDARVTPERQKGVNHNTTQHNRDMEEESSIPPLARSCPSGHPSGHPSGPPADPEIILVFDCQGEPRTWALTADRVRKYAELFPGIDVPAQLRLAHQWTLDNPARRKTARGMPSFLTSWLGRAVNYQRSPPPANGTPLRNGRESVDDMARRLAGDIQRKESS